MTKSLAETVLPKRIRDGIERTIDPHLRKRASGHGQCSRKMRDERRQFFHMMVAELWQLGYKIQKLESLAQKHVEALMNHWFEKGISAGTLHTRLSMISVLCNWLGKRNVVHEITHYLPEHAVRRKNVCTKSKAWQDNGVNPVDVIHKALELDERMAIILALMFAFGLRVKEAIELRPANALRDDGQALEIFAGTKGGRPRTVDVKTEPQRDILAWALRVAASRNNKRIRWSDCTFKQAQNRFYHYMRYHLKITRRDCGLTAHGLRHGYSQDEYFDLTGLQCPVKGGDPTKVDPEVHRQACLTVAEKLGHSRIEITGTYFGSYGHQLRGVKQVPKVDDETGPPKDQDEPKEKP